MAEYQSRRDQRVKPMYEFTCQLATLEPPPPPMRELFAALHGNQEATNPFYSAHRLAPVAGVHEPGEHRPDHRRRGECGLNAPPARPSFVANARAKGGLMVLK